MREAVQAGVSGRQRLIDGVSRSEVVWVVHAPVPRNVPLFRCAPVSLSYTAALASSELLRRKSGDVFVREAHLIHFPDDVQVVALVADEFRLLYQHTRFMRERTPSGVVPDSLFSDPYGGNSGVAYQSTARCVTDVPGPNIMTETAAAGTLTVPRRL